MRRGGWFHRIGRNLLWLGALGGMTCPACFNLASVTGGDGGVKSGSDAAFDSASPADSDAGGTPSCASLMASATPPAFCDDFDNEDGGAFAIWDQQVTSMGSGSVTVDALLSWSPPNSLLAQTSALTSGAYGEADLLKAFDQYMGHGISLTMTFEMYVQDWDTSTSGEIIAAEVLFKNSSIQYNQLAFNLLSLGSAGVAAQFIENATEADGGTSPLDYNFYPLQTHPAAKGWTSVEIDLSIPSYIGSSSNSVTVKLQGKPALDSQQLSVPIQGGIPVVHLGIGAVDFTPATAWAINYDNLVVNISQY
jgi:hypothetical protein